MKGNGYLGRIAALWVGLLFIAGEGQGAWAAGTAGVLHAANPITVAQRNVQPPSGPTPTPTVDILAHLRQMQEQNDRTSRALESLQRDYAVRIQTIDSLAAKEKLEMEFRRRLLAHKMSDIRQVLKTVSVGCVSAQTYLKGMDLYAKQADIANPWSDPDIQNFFDGLGDWGSVAGLGGATASSLERDDSTRQTFLLSGLALFGVSKLAQGLFGTKFNDKVKYLQFSREVFQALHKAQEKYEDYRRHIEAIAAADANLSSEASFNAAFPMDGKGSLDESRIHSDMTEDYVQNVLDMARDYNGAVEDLTDLFKPVVLKEEDPRSFSELPSQVQWRIKDVEDSYAEFKESFDSQWKWKLEIQPEVLRTLAATINWQ